MKKIYFLVLLLANYISNAQKNDSIIIEGRFKNPQSISKIAIKKFGVGAFEIASSAVENGQFKFKIGNIPAGVYRMQYGGGLNDHIDIILNNLDKNIYLEVDNGFADFSYSEENKKWHSYKKKIAQIEQELKQQDNLSAKKLQKQYNATFKKFLRQNKNSWAAEMVRNLPLRFDEKELLKPDYRDEHFWDGLNASNPDLLNTPIFVDQIFSYVKYYLDPKNGFADEKKTEHLILGTANIMEKFGKNSETQNFAFQFLSAGFQQVGEEQALQFLDENYGDIAQCLGEIEKTALEIRLGSYKATMPGTPAKDFVFTDSQGNHRQISSMKSDKIILVFYASWCPHCNEEMPKINEWAANHPEDTVVAISLDKDRKEFERSSKSYSNIISYCDYKGWESQPALDYNVIGTPTFLVLDSDKKIIGKFGSISKIKAAGIIK